ncbi:hypothetical protein [Vibrio xiamenensis]|nr:hypothetical protein [Vibrio xiamenensis]
MLRKLRNVISQFFSPKKAPDIKSDIALTTKLDDTHISHTSPNCMLALNFLGKDFLDVYEKEHNIILSHKTFGDGPVLDVREAGNAVYLDVDINGEILTFKSSSLSYKFFNGAFVTHTVADKYNSYKTFTEKKRRIKEEYRQAFQREAEPDEFHASSVLSEGNRWKKYGNDTSHAYSQTKGGGKGLHH